MGHNIRGYLIRNQDLSKLPFGTPNIGLKAGISFIPKYHYSLEEEFTSLGIPLALISTDYFGGVGEQSAIFWDGTKIDFNETEIHGPINDALKKLGVIKKESCDEFDTVGLGLHRSQDDFGEDLELEDDG